MTDNNNIALEIEEIDLYQFVDTVFTINAYLVDRNNNNQRVTGELSNIKVLLAFEGNASIENRCREHHPNLLEVIQNSGIKEDGHATIDLKIKDVSMSHERQRFVIYFECYRPHGDFNIISAVSGPIICIRYKLVMSESYTMPYIWYKDEGAKDKCIKILIKLMDNKNQIVSDKMVPLTAILIYSSGQPVHPSNVLTVFNDKDRPISIGMSGSEVIRFRVNEVSRNHRKQLFHLLIAPDTVNFPEFFEISPAKSIAFEVKSKRTSEARSLESQNHGFRSELRNNDPSGNATASWGWQSQSNTTSFGEEEDFASTTNGSTRTLSISLAAASSAPTIANNNFGSIISAMNNSSTATLNNNNVAAPLLAMATNLVQSTPSSNFMNNDLIAGPLQKRPRLQQGNDVEIAEQYPPVVASSNLSSSSLKTGLDDNILLTPPTFNNSPLETATTPITFANQSLSNPISSTVSTTSQGSFPSGSSCSASSTNHSNNSSASTGGSSGNSSTWAPNVEESILDAPLSALRQVVDWTQATCHLLAASVLPTLSNIQNISTTSSNNSPNSPCNAEHVQALLDIYTNRIQGSLAYLQSYFAITEQYAVPYHQHAYYLAFQQQTYLQQLDYALYHFTAHSSASSANPASAVGNGASTGVQKYKRQFFIPPGGVSMVNSGMNNYNGRRLSPLQTFAPAISLPAFLPPANLSSFHSTTTGQTARPLTNQPSPSLQQHSNEDLVTAIVAKAVMTDTFYDQEHHELGLPAFTGDRSQFHLIGFYRRSNSFPPTNASATTFEEDDVNLSNSTISSNQSSGKSFHFVPITDIDHFQQLPPDSQSAITTELLSLMEQAEEEDDATYYLSNYCLSSQQQNMEVTKMQALESMKQEIFQRLQYLSERTQVHPVEYSTVSTSHDGTTTATNLLPDSAVCAIEGGSRREANPSLCKDHHTTESQHSESQHNNHHRSASYSRHSVNKKLHPQYIYHVKHSSSYSKKQKRS